MKKLALLLIGLAALCLGGCSAGAVDTDPGPEDVGEVSEALTCPNHPTGGIGDTTATYPLTGYITQIKPNSVYSFLLDVTKTAWGGATSTTSVNFGTAPGNANITFSGSGWTGSLVSPATKINVCEPQGSAAASSMCENKVCMQGAGNYCVFVNGSLSFTFRDGNLVPSGNPNFGSGVVGIHGLAPGEAGKLGIYYDNGGGGASVRKWTLTNATKCP
jgi:hypothetical protein